MVSPGQSNEGEHTMLAHRQYQRNGYRHCRTEQEYRDFCGVHDGKRRSPAQWERMRMQKIMQHELSEYGNYTQHINELYEVLHGIY